MSLITRYLLRETSGAWLVVIAVLFLIFMTNQFADILGDAAANRLPREAVFAVFALTSMSYLTALTPIAHFLGVMFALARLSRDSEMAALAACGIGPVQLLAPGVSNRASHASNAASANVRMLTGARSCTGPIPQAASAAISESRLKRASANMTPKKCAIGVSAVR